jgi:hypothetical protein
LDPVNDDLLLRPPSWEPDVFPERIGQLAFQPHANHKKMTHRADGVTINVTARASGIRPYGILALHEHCSLSFGIGTLVPLLNTETGYNIE